MSWHQADGVGAGDANRERGFDEVGVADVLLGVAGPDAVVRRRHVDDRDGAVQIRILGPMS